MSKIDWSKFDEGLDVEKLSQDVKEIEQNGDNYKEVPIGTYEVAIDKLELSESKKHDPMLVCWFKVLNGEYKNSKIFMNQLIKEPFQLHIAHEFLRSLDTGLEILFSTYIQYGSLIENVKTEIDNQKLEYGLELGEKKGYKTFKITEVFETDK